MDFTNAVSGDVQSLVLEKKHSRDAKVLALHRRKTTIPLNKSTLRGLRYNSRISLLSFLPRDPNVAKSDLTRRRRTR